MSPSDPEEIQLVFRFEDFAGPEEETDEFEDDEPCDSPVMVICLGGDRFQVCDPTSLIPFGPFGPFLSAGTKIRVKKMEAGSYRLVEIAERPQVWTWRFASRQWHTLEGDVKASVDALSEKGCRWEWCAGNFTIQKIRLPNEAAPDPSLAETIAALARRVEPSLPEL